jgi:predicted RNA binding protein YcfA (HicA-like mRNA interferase family)
MTSREIIRVLLRAGWTRDRQEGSHVILERPDGTGTVVVPDHPGDLRPGTFRGILRQAGITPAEFERMRRN